MSCVQVRRPSGSTTISSVHMYGQHKMDSSGLPTAVDALFAQRILRIVRPSIFVYANLRSRHAKDIAIHRHRQRFDQFGGGGCKILATLLAGGIRMVGCDAVDSLSHI